jgi:hypothetical protein
MYAGQGCVQPDSVVRVHPSFQSLEILVLADRFYSPLDRLAALSYAAFTPKGAIGFSNQRWKNPQSFKGG